MFSHDFTTLISELQAGKGECFAIWFFVVILMGAGDYCIPFASGLRYIRHDGA